MFVKQSYSVPFLLLPLGLVLSVGSARAQELASVPASPPGAATGSGAVNANKQGKNLFDYTAKDGGVPADMANRVRFEQKLDAAIPIQLSFKNEAGKMVKLGDYLGTKPVLLNMIQYTCDMVCSAEMEALTASLNELKFDAGKEFDIVTVSIDPRETPLIATDAKEERLKQYQRPTASQGWHFLTGGEKEIKALAASIGYNYIWDEGSQQYVHPDGLVLVTPEGKVSRYFLQLDYNPRDIRFSIIQASKEQIGTVIDRIALSCFHYDPLTGKYSLQIMSVLRLAGLAFVLGGLTVLGGWVLKEKTAGSGGGTGGKSVTGTKSKKA